MKVRLFITTALALVLSVQTSFAQMPLDLFVKGTIGWAHYDDVIYGTLAPQVGVYTDIALMDPLVIQTGAEIRLTGFGNKTVFSGLSGLSSDFYEIYHYRMNYLAIPVHIKYNDTSNPDSFLNGLYAGFGVNLPFMASYNWKRYKTGLNSKEVDASGGGKLDLDKLSSPALSICLGVDERLDDKWGINIQIERILNTRASTSGYYIASFRIGVVYYL